MVAGDVRPYSVVVGNPCREIRRRFSNDQIERLQRISWWTWPRSRIVEEIGLLCSPNIDAFIEKWTPR